MATNGQIARVHYRGTDDHGVVFDSTEGTEPLRFIIGSGAVIHGFDRAVLGMAVGETVTVRIPCAEAFGERRKEAIQSVLAMTVPNAQHLREGATVNFNAPDGEPVAARVLSIENGTISFDFNHRLAGRDLTFEITLVDLGDA